MSDDRFGQTAFDELKNFLAEIPAVTILSGEIAAEGNWWIKFDIDIEDDLAWNVVQELAHLLNDISLEERLATIFMPVSPPPYLNGGPDAYLSWVIETRGPVEPRALKELLEGRLPSPVSDAAEWIEE